MKVAVASNNAGKINEFKQILEPLGYEVISAKALGVDMDCVEETGTTFEENALIKARYLYEVTKISSIADDSGLVIESLPDILGVYSARFMGKDTPYDVKNRKVIELLEDKSRNAYFISSIAYVSNVDVKTFEGRCDGEISYEILGESGFGFDPIFVPEGLTQSFGQLDPKTKNTYSHRGKALRKLDCYFKEHSS